MYPWHSDGQLWTDNHQAIPFIHTIPLAVRYTVLSLIANIKYSPSWPCPVSVSAKLFWWMSLCLIYLTVSYSLLSHLCSYGATALHRACVEVQVEQRTWVRNVQVCIWINTSFQAWQSTKHHKHMPKEGQISVLCTVQKLLQPVSICTWVKILKFTWPKALFNWECPLISFFICVRNREE